MKKKLFFPVLIMLVIGIVSQALLAQVSLTGPDLDKFSWKNVGPFNFSGRISHVAVPRGQSIAYYVGVSTGGVWKTEDGGISFKPIFEKNGNMSIGYIAIAPSNPKIIYVGTGESLHARASYRGNGIWKSIDGGEKWEFAGLKDSFFIPRIEIDAKNPDIVYAAAEGKLYDNAMDCERGLYKSIDGGKSWKRVLDLKDRGVVDFVIDPGNSDTIIAAGYKFYRRTWTFIDRQPGNFLYKSTDGGKTWKKLENGLPMNIKAGRNGLAIYEKDPKIVYARIDEEVSVGLSESEGSAKFRAGERGMFKDGSYFNQFKTYKIDPRLQKLVDFKPLSAKDEKELAKALNKLVEDKTFIKTIKIDMPAFIKTARALYGKDEKIGESLNEIEKTLKRDVEKKDLYKKVNRDFLFALLAHNKENIEFKDTIVIKDLEKVKIHPDLLGLITFEKKEEKPEKKDDKAEVKPEDKAKIEPAKPETEKPAEKEKKLITDEKTLLAEINTWADDPELIFRLKADLKGLEEKVAKVYEKEEATLKRLKEAKDDFTELTETKGRYQTINRFVLQTLYANCLKVMEPEKKAGFIFRSEDQGETWKRMTEYKLVLGSDVVNQVEAGYNGKLLVDPNNDKIIYAHETECVKSEDAGKSFKFLKWEDDNKVHVDSRYIWVDPLNSNHILNCNDGGLSESWDGGKHWSQKATILAQQFYDVSTDNEMPYNVMGGTQDNGCWIGPSQNRNQQGVYPADWHYLPSGDGFYTVRDWWNPEYIYFESQFGYSNRKNLKTGEMISLAKRNSPEERAEGKPRQRYQWNAPIVLSPHNPGIVFVCSQFVNRSMKHGDKDSFITISPDLSKNIKERIEESKKTNLQYGTIFTFAESPKKPGLYWAGTDDGNLQLSTDWGTNWTNITDRFYSKDGKPKGGIKGARIPYDRWVMRVEPSNHQEKRCFVAYSGYRSHNEEKAYIYVTDDLGLTWTDISGGLKMQVNDIEEDPGNENILYLAGDYGLYVSFNRGKDWQKMSSTAPDVIIKDLAIQERDRDLVIGTYGLGIYIADISPFKEFKEETFKKEYHLFDIQAAVKWNRLEIRGESYGEFPRVKNPPLGSDIYYYLQKPADSVAILIKNPEGKVIKTLKGSKEKGLQKTSWDLSAMSDSHDDNGDDDDDNWWAGAASASAGQYTVVLKVNDKEVETKKINVIPDPLDQR